MKSKLIRVTTVPASLGGLLRGQLKFMSKYFEVVGIASAHCGSKSAFIDVLENVGKEEECRVIPVEMTRKITPIADLRATWALYRIFKKEKPAIVHTHTPKAGTLGMLAAYFAGVPNRFHTVAGLPLLEAEGKKRVLLNTVEKITYKCATKIYPNSFGLKDIIIQNNFTNEEKLKVIGNGSSNGVDTNFFDDSNVSRETIDGIKKKYNIPKNDFIFLFVGRLVTDKGINELIEAFDKLNRDNDHIKLILVGSREQELDPLNKTTDTILNENTNIITVGTQTDVRPFYALSDYLVFPSYREGFPNVVMEAGSMGLPCIVSNINGCNEIIIDGENGHIIPVKDTEAIYLKMKLVLEDFRLKKGFSSETIRKLIKTRYSRQYVWEQILMEYKSL